MAIQPYGMTHESPDMTIPHADPANDANTQGPATGKKGRAQRELSNTKRAAQNRAAQRAFRLRKEQHINKLEDDVKRYQIMEDNCKTLQHENSTLRNYITLLQARMTDKNISYPPVPEQGTLRSLSVSAPDHEHDHQDQATVYHPVSDQQSTQHHQHDQHRYPDPSPPQSHAPSSNAYPQPTHDQQHHQHELATNPQSSHQDPANDPLPAAAISQLQAAAAQAGSMDRPHSISPTHPDQHQRPHSQDPQYVRASEYPAHKRPRVDLPHQTRKYFCSESLDLTSANYRTETLSDKPST
jgi:hypothetical protein